MRRSKGLLLTKSVMEDFKRLPRSIQQLSEAKKFPALGSLNNPAPHSKPLVEVVHHLLGQPSKILKLVAFDHAPNAKRRTPG